MTLAQTTNPAGLLLLLRPALLPLLRQQERHGEGAWSKCARLHWLDLMGRCAQGQGPGAGSLRPGLTGGKRVLAVLLPLLLQQRRLQQRQRRPLRHPLLLLPLCLGGPGALVGVCLFDENDQQQQQGHQHLTQLYQQDPQQQQQRDHQQQWRQQGVRLVLWGRLLPTLLRFLRSLQQQQQQQRTPLTRPQSTLPHPGETSRYAR
jgi:hypothetical protein